MNGWVEGTDNETDERVYQCIRRNHALSRRSPELVICRQALVGGPYDKGCSLVRMFHWGHHAQAGDGLCGHNYDRKRHQQKVRRPVTIWVTKINCERCTATWGNTSETILNTNIFHVFIDGFNIFLKQFRSLHSSKFPSVESFPTSHRQWLAAGTSVRGVAAGLSARQPGMSIIKRDVALRKIRI